jgi:uncharacterized repeat protein (TIGR03803 family)
VVTLFVLLAVISARPQNPVPPTAREAATLPRYAAKLHPATPPAMNKPRAAVPVRGGVDGRQLSSCSNRSSPDCGGGPGYENGPVNGTVDAWTINYGYVVSDSFYASIGDFVGSFDIYVWEFPGDTITSVQWSITSEPNGGTIYGSGTVDIFLRDVFISTNQYGYDIDKISATFPGAFVPSGTSWLNLFNASVPSGEPVYWDENSGVGCNSPGCPSKAYESANGTIPSEAFDIGGGQPGPSCFEARGSLQIIHDFAPQEGVPNGLTTDKAGNFYGAANGGTGTNHAGLAYELLPKGQGWIFNPLYNFLGGSGGQNPLPLILGPDGALYGTASGGSYDFGLVFKLTPGPTACLTSLCPWTESVLYQVKIFDAAPQPANLVADQVGNLYGTSAYGGAYGYGAVFELTPSLGGWEEKILYSFTGWGSDGGIPTSLLLGNDGNLYGTTTAGPLGFYTGEVFQLVPSPADSWTLNVIHAFTHGTYGSDGSQPYGLVQDRLGNLYGISTTGDYDLVFSVIVFVLSPSDGSWAFSVAYESPEGNWILPAATSYPATDTAGNVYFAVGLENPSGSPAWGAVMMRPPGGDFSNL